VKKNIVKPRVATAAGRKNILKPRLAAATGDRYVDFTDVKFRVAARRLYDIGESNPVPASGL